MEDSLLTKCPHCKTLFRISYEHLAIAEGQVRCGVCFKVFSAPNEGLSYSEGPGSDRDKTFGRDKKTVKQKKSAQTSAREIAAGKTAESSTDSAQQPDAGPETEPKALEPGARELPQDHHMEQLQIVAEPVEAMLFRKQQARGGRPLLWGTLSMAALILLSLQWAWFNMERYAHEPQWHGWYKMACRSLNCSLPEYRDIEQLSTERLEVRSHPDYRNALIVDMIVNNAGHDRQPLPVLNMEFYDINGATLAQRTFTPADYLADVNNPISSMPVRSPIHFSFAIIDPGDQAVNYAVRLQEAVN